MKKQEKSTKISVRLDCEATEKLKKANENGYTTTQYINESIKNSGVVDLTFMREAMIHICRLEEELEYETDAEVKIIMRKELNKLCLALRSCQKHT